MDQRSRSVLLISSLVAVWEENKEGKFIVVTRGESYQYLIVTHMPKTVDEMAEMYEFNTKKKQTLYDLLSSNFDEF